MNVPFERMNSLNKLPTTISIQILPAEGAASINGRPVYLLEAQSDTTMFKVIGPDNPTEDEFIEYLGMSPFSCDLKKYDEKTGVGSLKFSDGEAPLPGAIISVGDSFPPQETERFLLDILDDPFVDSTTIEEFFDKLDTHDWYFVFSDDPVIYAMGSEERNYLSLLARHLGPDYVALMDAFGAHHFSGEAWSNKQAMKPIKPVKGVLILPNKIEADLAKLFAALQSPTKISASFPEILKSPLDAPLNMGPDEGEDNGEYFVQVVEDTLIITGKGYLASHEWKPDWNGKSRSFRVVGVEPVVTIQSVEGTVLEFNTREEAYAFMDKIESAITSKMPHAEGDLLEEDTPIQMKNNLPMNMGHLFSKAVVIFGAFVVASVLIIPATKIFIDLYSKYGHV
jgi:hypothetical protein